MMTQKNKILLTIGAIFLLANQKLFGSAGSSNAGMVSYLGQSNLPRGMRNNNPGNIRIGASEWQGKISIDKNTDGAFEQFVAYPWGVRAMIKLLKDTYMGKWGLVTIRDIINKYAPSSENDSVAYINTVSNKTGLSPDQTLSPDKTTIKKLVQAMAKVENGRDAIDSGMFELGWSLL